MTGLMSRGAGSVYGGKLTKIPTFILIFSFALSLIFPGGIKAFLLNKNNVVVQKQMLSKTQPGIQVVSTPVRSVTVAVAEPILVGVSQNCQLTGNQINFLQDSGSFNLNQPANCFTINNLTNALQVGSTALAVKALHQVVKSVSVLDNKSQISNAELSHSGLPQENPVLPAVALVIVLLVIGSTKYLARKVLNSTSLIKKSLNIHQLRVMRC